MASLRLLSRTSNSFRLPTCYGMKNTRNFPIMCVAHDRYLHLSPRTCKEPSTSPTSAPKPHQHPENPTLPSFNLLQQTQESRPAVRYTVYAGLGLMAAVESTFWFNVIKAKFFPSASGEEQQKDEEFMGRIRDAVKGYRKVLMTNYGRYYAAHMWGLGYGGLDGLENE